MPSDRPTTVARTDGTARGAPLQVPADPNRVTWPAILVAVSLGFGTLIAVLLLILPGAIVARAAQLTWPIAVAVGPALTYGVVGLAIIPFGALGIPWNAWTALAGAGRGDRRRGEFAGAVRPLPRHRRRSADGVAAAGADGGRRGPAGRPADRLRRLPRDAALAVHPEHLGRGLARQHDPLHPRHRPGVVDPHGRAAQRRNPRAAVLPVDVPRAGRGARSAHRRRTHHRATP